MRKLFSAMLLLALAAGLSVPAFAAADTPFPDVPADAPYAEAVQELFEYEIMKGDEAGNFNPNATITRQEMVTLVCRLLDEEDTALAIKTCAFTDVPDDLWSVGYIAWAAQNKIVDGYGGGLFGPKDNITIAQTAKLLVSAWGYDDEAVQAGGWPNGYLSVAEELGLLDGVSGDRSGPASRAVAAMMTYRIMLSPTAAEQGGYGA